MKNISKFLAIAIVATGTLVACGGESKPDHKEGKDRPGGKREHRKHDHGHPPPDHHGDRKGPPRGRGGHNPEQTKTLEEIGGYTFGDVAMDFSLKNVDGKMVSLADYDDAKGYIVVFTCNECPFAKMYEDRLIDLHNKYASKGYPVIAINANASEKNDKENYASMQKRAKEKSFPFAYLADSKHEISPAYGAVRTPHVFLLDQDRKVQYIGTIDDNAKSADDVKVKYVEDAIKALQNGSKPNPNFTKAVGCPVKI